MPPPGGPPAYRTQSAARRLKLGWRKFEPTEPGRNPAIVHQYPYARAKNVLSLQVATAVHHRVVR
jgi:hypothetical protein